MDRPQLPPYDATNPTAVALALLTTIEDVAKRWEADGNADDARHIRERGPRFAADLAAVIAQDPDTALPALEDYLRQEATRHQP